MTKRKSTIRIVWGKVAGRRRGKLIVRIRAELMQCGLLVILSGIYMNSYIFHGYIPKRLFQREHFASLVNSGTAD
jgi:hypothetical protein